MSGTSDECMRIHPQRLMILVAAIIVGGGLPRVVGRAPCGRAAHQRARPSRPTAASSGGHYWLAHSSLGFTHRPETRTRALANLKQPAHSPSCTTSSLLAEVRS